ncbi:putative nucleic acid-binding protein [Streptomyces sp. Amel2xB2]|uniref:Ribonuclease VapC n=1 Tax=Streptomyces nanshensis TaxID=518642 RepID=A0A1E7L7R3_9ACTN|nr:MULTISPECIES: PIN domain-containing protein [Streptomyces]OEV12214.1 twitching motility protein PilT [Streptomyces nanshensis]RAJ70121.1 putative nucleic acid-binding protein [Streptomyces sp. Amel2xB2]
MIVIGDTSGLVAAFNVAGPEHQGARRALREASATVVSPLVFQEVEHIITRNIDRKTAYAVNDWLLAQERSMRVLTPEIAAGTLRKSRSVQTRYTDLCLDLTDAVNVVLAEEYDTETILTLDRRDFRAVRPLTGHTAFRLLPDDL